MKFSFQRKKIVIRSLAAACCTAALLVFFACSDDDPAAPDTPAAEVPVVATAAMEQISGASAQGGGTVTDDGGDAVTARGVCWSTDPQPTVLDDHTSDGVGEGDFTSPLSGLITGTTYHVRAYATNSVGTGYGEAIEFATGAYVEEGVGGSPLDITGSLPYYGEVAIDGLSSYLITGVTPDAIYTTVLALADGLPYQSVPNAVGSGGIACGWNNEDPDAIIECAMRASGEGGMQFSVHGDGTIGGAFTVSIAAGGIVNEGSPDDPVVVSSFPFSASAYSQGHYLLTGLAPGEPYAVEFTTASSPVALFVLPDETYGSQPAICLSVHGSGDSCNVVADGLGQIYLVTNAQQQIYGVTYTISVTATDLANEGAINSPLDIGGQLPYTGMVHLGSSWYIVGDLDAFQPYTITLADASDDARLYVYGPGWTVAGGPRTDSWQNWANGDGVSIACVSEADVEGDIRIEVRGFETAAGATFDLAVAPGGIPNQGYYGTPVDLTGATPYGGTVYNGPSYYVFTGLAAQTDYTLTLSNLSANLTLWVYDDAAYENQICASQATGTGDETCVVQTTTGEIHLRVGPADNNLGATFVIHLTQ